MIIDRLENAGTYTGRDNGITSALNFLKTTDLEKAGEGRHDINGDAVYALLMDYRTKPASEGVWIDAISTCSTSSAVLNAWAMRTWMHWWPDPIIKRKITCS